MLNKALDDEIKSWKPKLSDVTAMAKLVSRETIESFAYELASYHKPARTDWKKKFNVTESGLVKPTVNSTKSEIKKNTNGYYCVKCEVPIPDNVAKFCWNNKARFGGRPYCRNCQKTIKA